MLFSRPGKEPLGGCNVTPFAQEKVDGSTLLIDGAIEVDPLAFDFDVGFIHTPRVTDRGCVMIPALLEFPTYCCTHRRIVVWDRVMPRSAIIWTRSRKLSLNVMYHLTHRMMISWSKCRPFQQFAPEPSGAYRWTQRHTYRAGVVKQLEVRNPFPFDLSTLKSG